MSTMTPERTAALTKRRNAPLATPSDLGSAAVTDISAVMNGILADVFALYLKTKNFHWHMSGPHFRDYHLMLDEQADQLFAMTDPMAECIRKLGGLTIRSIGHIARTQRILDNDAEHVEPRFEVEKADERQLAVPSLKKALLSGEAVAASFRDALGARGIRAQQVYATADVGSIAYESEARAGLIVDEGVLVEIVRAGTGDPVAAGEVGEVVVTLLSNREYPLIRFGTGDLSAIVPSSLSTASPCGRTNMRIKGWMGRADQTTKVKGMFVHPSQIAAIVARHPEIAKARLVVDNPQGTDTMTLHVEIPEGDSSTRETIVASIREVTKLRGEVTIGAPGELANDGKVIDDVRRYD